MNGRRLNYYTIVVTYKNGEAVTTTYFGTDDDTQALLKQYRTMFVASNIVVFKKERKNTAPRSGRTNPNLEFCAIEGKEIDPDWRMPTTTSDA